MRKKKISERIERYIYENVEFYKNPKKHLDKMKFSLKIFFVLYIASLFVIIYFMNNYHISIIYLFIFMIIGYVVFSYIE